MISATEALDRLREGNRRFAAGEPQQNVHISHSKRVELAREQRPFAIVLGCSDSRVPAEIVFDQGLGDVFSVRIAGNIVNNDILGSMEYAVKYAGSKLVMVLGHSKCGAVTSACSHVEDGHITELLSHIKPAIEKVGKDSNEPEIVEEVAEMNVHHAMDEIRRRSTTIAGMEKEGKIMIIGGMYDIESGVVNFFE
jgi:carbonic anhydrase